MRNSGTRTRNPNVVDWSKDPDRSEKYKTSNVDFFADAMRALSDQGYGDGAYLTIGFVGQTDLAGVTLRRAQEILRWDMRPSLWSHVFVITSYLDSAEPADLTLSEVTLHSRSGAFPDPATNGVVVGKLGLYDNPKVDANVGIVAIQMAEEEPAKVAARAMGDVNLERLRYDLWETLGIWQSYFWSAGTAPNPFREGVPLFSAAFVEYCFESIFLDLSPGASERNSAPEHLWNSAVYWHEGFSTLNHEMAGYFLVRDPGCAVADGPRRLYPGNPPGPSAVRAARVDDGPLLREIEGLAGQGSGTSGWARSPMTSRCRPLPSGPTPGGRSWVAVDDADTPVGYVLVDLVDGNVHVEQLSVRPDQQRQGTGRALVEHVRAWAVDHGRPGITLTTFTDVPWNRPLFERLGFRVLGEDEIGPGLQEVRRTEANRGLDPS